MRYGTIPGINRPVPRLVQGGARLTTRNQDAANRLLDEVYTRGCTAVDTARTYGDGTSERALGDWIRSRGVRDTFVVMTKGGKAPDGEPRLDARGILSDLEESLNALQVNHIDLYLLHRDDASVETAGIVDILNGALRAGKIRAFGGSNWPHQRLRAANEYARRSGLVPFAASSPQFSLAEQFTIPWPGCISIGGPEGVEARDWYAVTQFPLMTWSSMAGGFFSGQFRRDNLDSFTGFWDQSCVETYCREPNFRRLDRARELAAAKGVTVSRIALAYVLQQPLNMFCLASCANGVEMDDNLGAFDLVLGREELAWLDLRENGIG